MAPIEVLQLLPEIDPGGAERIVLTLARLLPRDRFHVSLAALDGRGSLAAAFGQAGCPVHDLGARRRWSPGAVRRLRNLVERTRPAILHSHLFRAHLAAGRIVRTGSPPVVIATEHQADPRSWALALLRRATRRAAVVTAVSEGVRRRLIDRGFDARRVRTLANGIDLEPLDSASPLSLGELGLPAEARVILFVGRLTRQKGLDVLLRAVASLAAELPELHLVVAGDGRDRPALERLAARLGLGGRVRFLGRRDDIPQLMNTAHLAALPSRWEGLSLVLLEAMAAGLPVVATDVPGQAEVLADGASGLLVPPEDVAHLAAAIRRAATDDALRRRLGAAARSAVLADYTASAMVARYVALYEQCLAASSA